MPILGSCCVCLDLKVGTTIIGVICLLSSITNTISWGIASATMALFDSAKQAGIASGEIDPNLMLTDIHKFNEEGLKTIDKLAKDGINIFEDSDYEDVKKFNEAREDQDMKELVAWFYDNIGTVKNICYFLLFFSLLLLIVSSMLIHGVRRNRRGLLAPWIVVEAIKALLFLIGAISLFATFGDNSVIVYTGLSFFVAVGLEVYFILVVVSQYQALGIIRMHDHEMK